MWERAPWLLLLVVLGAGDPLDDYGAYRDALGFVDECGSKTLSLCFKERALKYLEALPNNIDLGGGLKIKQIDGNEARSAKDQDAPLPTEPQAREEAVDNRLWDKLARYLSSHTVELKLPKEALKEVEKSMEEGRGKGGGGGGKGGGGGGGMRMKGMMMLFQLKAAMIGALALKLIGLVAFKALLVAKVALTIASIIALKKLLEQKHHTSTYEVLAHPHHEEYGHYDRAFSQDVAYKGQEPARNAYGGYSYN